MKTLQAILLSATVVGANPVHALINDSKFGDPGELFVSIYDADGKKTYYKDLGISMGDFVLNPASASFDLAGDPDYAGFLGKDSLVYNVAAVNALLTDFSNFTSWGYLATSSQGSDIFDTDFTFVGDAFQKIQSHAVALNPTGFTNADGQAAENQSGTYESDALGYHGKGTWGPTMGGAVGGNTEGKVDADLDFYFVNNSTGSDDGGRVTKLGVWKLSAAGQLNFAGTGTATPTPTPTASPTPTPSASPTPTPVPTPLDLSSAASFKVKQKQALTWRPDLGKVSKKKIVVFKFQKDGGKFKLIGTAKYGKGVFKWKPAKKHKTESGVIQGCVKAAKGSAPICDTLSVSVQ